MINKKHELVILFIILFIIYVNIRGFSEDALYILILTALFMKLKSFGILKNLMYEHRLYNLRKLTNSIAKQQNALNNIKTIKGDSQKYFDYELSLVSSDQTVIISNTINKKCSPYTS
jgi:phosphopantetheine adenylyltransferase